MKQIFTFEHWHWRVVKWHTEIQLDAAGRIDAYTSFIQHEYVTRDSNFHMSKKMSASIHKVACCLAAVF